MKLSAIAAAMPARQRSAGKLLVAFFAAMLAFTVVSRALDAAAVPKVNVTKPSPGSISRTITAEGTIEPLGQTVVSVPAGLPLDGLLVEEGEEVSAGDVLATLDLAALQKQAETTKRELEKLRLSAEVARLQTEEANTDRVEQAKRDIKRAEEDLKRAKEEGTASVRRAEKDLSDARRDRKDLRDSDAGDDYLLEADRSISSLLRDLDDANRSAEKLESEAERALEDAQTALEEAVAAQETESANKATENYRRSLEGQIAALDMIPQQEKLAELQELLETEGRILAPVDGVVTTITGQLGANTSGEGLVLLADRSRGSIFRATVEEGQGKHLTRGDAVSINVAGVSQPVEATLTSLTAPEEKGGDYSLTVQLPGFTPEAGSTAKLTVEKTSQRYLQLVPRSALHMNSGSDTSGYVYVLRERSTTLGIQTFAEQVQVQVLEQGTKAAAVSGSFDPGDRIISASARPLSSGDRVRVEEA